jgi:hypothetical protein
MSPRTKLVLGAVLLSLPTLVCNPESVQAEAELTPNPTPWKTRLYGANKDRRAARKKRAKKLGRRR